MMKSWKRPIVVAIILVLMISITACNKGNSEMEPKLSQVKSICELAVIDCYFHNVAKFTEKDAAGILWWKKDKKFWIEYSGKVRIGVDLSLVQVDVKENTVTVTLPEPRVLSATVDPDSLTKDSYIIDIDSAKVTAEDEIKAFEVAQKQLVEHAENDILLFANAQERVQTLIEDYIKNIGEAIGTAYEIEWKYISAEPSSTESKTEPTSETTIPTSESSTEGTTESTTGSTTGN